MLTECDLLEQGRMRVLYIYTRAGVVEIITASHFKLLQNQHGRTGYRVCAY